MAESSSKRRLKCDYKLLKARKGLERLQQLIPNSSKFDEVKVLTDAMFYIIQLESRVEQLRKSVKRNKKSSITSTVTSCDVYSPESQMALDSSADLPDDLKDIDEAELRELHEMP